MTDNLKADIKTCLAAVDSLADSVDVVAKRAISENSKEDIGVGIHLMNLLKLLKQAKSEAERTGWTLEKKNVV